jgi:hypothetical protein
MVGKTDFNSSSSAPQAANSVTSMKDGRKEPTCAHQIIGKTLRMIGDDLNFKFGSSRDPPSLSGIVIMKTFKELLKDGRQ